MVLRGALFLLGFVYAGSQPVGYGLGDLALRAFSTALTLGTVVFVLWIVLAWLSAKGQRPAYTAAELEHARASGVVSDAMYAFELATVELSRTGKRRLFTCGRCCKGFSLAWKRCDHCKATLDEFPPIDTGRVV